ncbi:hypothetical protein [Streptomyces europaeiscabiei]|uniref:hypothetical protein n=1 Tax=Streptomyces europaeiscabiei TaxID=146819 RepID=UPI0029B241A0|nr:hypothetical protein [Streptomyces europaeiscabiei]MDX2765650.1 hypothetical protein [Streptomyces europaeiscabiei]
MKRKEIQGLIRDCEQRSTQARQKFEVTGDAALLEEIEKAETAIDRLVFVDPED